MEKAKPSSSLSIFKQVTFIDVQDSYLYDTPLKCFFTVAPTFCPTPKDRIGLYKVGWRTVEDCILFVSVELPLAEGSGTVTFGDFLKNDEEFYQFCYINGPHQICGASTPFQFVPDDFEVIKSMTDMSVFDSFMETESRDEEKSEKQTPSLDQSSVKELVDLRMENMELQSKLLEATTSLEKSETATTALKTQLASLTEENQWLRGISAVIDHNQDQTGDTLYKTPTWFHNPYANYLPTEFKNPAHVNVVCSNIWPRTSEKNTALRS